MFLFHPQRAEFILTHLDGTLARRAMESSVRILARREPCANAKHPRILSYGPVFEDSFLTCIEDRIELCSWDTLQPYEHWHHPVRQGRWTHCAHSLDGAWVAASDDAHTLHIHHRISGKVFTTSLESHHIAALCFDQNAYWLAALLTNAQQGELRVWTLARGRPHVHMRALDRRGLYSPCLSLRDVTGSLTFCDDGDSLMMYASTSKRESFVEQGWRGTLSAYDVRSGRVIWGSMIDSKITGDVREIHELGAEDDAGVRSMIYAQPEGTKVYCGTTHGGLVVVDGRDGALIQMAHLGTTQSVRQVHTCHNKEVWIRTAQGHVFCAHM